eukprot:6183328-Pleurochrysis_carterae.AAC.2
MTIGHDTHEDIDALFKRLTISSQKMRMVLTPDLFLQYLKAAVPDAHVYDIVNYTHDWAEFFKEGIDGGLAGITGARECILKKYVDGGPSCSGTSPTLRTAASARRARMQMRNQSFRRSTAKCNTSFALTASKGFAEAYLLFPQHARLINCMLALGAACIVGIATCFCYCLSGAGPEGVPLLAHFARSAKDKRVARFDRPLKPTWRKSSKAALVVHRVRSGRQGKVLGILPGEFVGGHS